MKKINVPRKVHVPLIYCVFSIVWIVLTDRLNQLIAGNLELATKISIVKGTAFVVVSTLLIFLLLAFDERKEKTLETELTSLQDGFTKLYDRNPQPMLIYDPDAMKIITANEAALKLFEYSRNEFLALHLNNLVVLEDQDLLNLSLSKHFEGYRKMGPWRMISKSGQVLYSYVMMTSIDLSGKSADLIAILDISEQKAIENTLKQTETERDSFQAFGFSISHDLRSSLRAITGYSQIITEDYADKLDPQVLEYLEQLRQAGQSMNTMIDSLLMLTGITHHSLNIDYVNLGGIAARVAEQLRGQDPTRKVAFNLLPDVIARCDADLMRIALYDLMENAWKYTSKSSEPQIEFGLKLNSQGERVFFVRDNGVGFDQAKAAEMFKPFQRLHPASEFKGNGVGLSVVSRIIERHKGNIWAEGEIGKGAVFYFTLGLDEEALPA